MRGVRVLLVMLLTGLSGPAWATTNTYQAGATGCGNTNCGAATPDNWMDNGNATTNNGTGVGIQVGRNFVGNVFRGLLEFNVNDIPNGSTITAASLTINITVVNSPTKHTMCRLRRADWSETQSTWNIYKTSNNWSTAGAANTTNDIESPGSGNTACVGFTPNTSTGAQTITGLAGLVQDALDNQSGILRIRDAQDNESANNHSFQYASQDNGTQANRPKLSVDYTAPTTTTTSTSSSTTTVTTSTSTSTTSTSTTSTTAAAGTNVQRLPLLGVGRLDLPADGDWTCHPATDTDLCPMGMAG